MPLTSPNHCAEAIFENGSNVIKSVINIFFIIYLSLIKIVLINDTIKFDKYLK